MFPWIPLREPVGTTAEAGRARYEARLWQVVEEKRSDGAILLLRREGDKAWDSERQALFERAAGAPVELPLYKLDALVFPGAMGRPIPLDRLAMRNPPVTAEELSVLGPALVELRARRPNAGLRKALFVAEANACVADADAREDLDIGSFAQEIVTGGVRSPRLSVPQMHAINPWVEPEDIESFLSLLGLPGDHGVRKASASLPETSFALPGRPALEKLFQEEIVDYWRRQPNYAAMGVSPPAGLLLHGPPGSGKSHAVGKLAVFLGWRVFELGSGSVGSALAHETPRRITSLFREAAATSPSIVLIEEFDAFGCDRGGLSNDYRREEAATLLREIETAPQRDVLVVATTNDLSAVDHAFLRKGRFDCVVEVGYPNLPEVVAVLSDLLAKRPTAAGIALETFARRLVGRSLADARWLVDRAARIAVSEDKNAIDELCLQRAVRMLEGREDSAPRRLV